MRLVAVVVTLLLAWPVQAADKIQGVIWHTPGDADSVSLIQESLADPVVKAYADAHFSFTLKDALGAEQDEAMELGVILLPTLIFRDADGAEIIRYEGHFSPRFLFGALMFLGTGEYKDPQYRGMLVRWSRANSARVRQAYEDAKP